MHQRRSFLDDSNPRVAMAVDSTLMPLRQPKPPLQLEVILDVGHGVPAYEQAGAEAAHHTSHLLVDRIAVAAQAIEDRIEGELSLCRALTRRVQGRGDLLDRRDVTPDRLLLGAHQVQPLVDTSSQPAQLLLGEPPFFASRFRWIDCRTSPKASAIRNPGGCSGPPWSSLRIPRTAAV